MSNKPTAATNHAALMKHEAICAERWKQAFKNFDQLNESMAKIQWWIIGAMSTMIISILGGIAITLYRTII
tara:strand:- start:446 stop:658 length:213 start_codon:yes stop_codon:yes gene_type:complete